MTDANRRAEDRRRGDRRGRVRRSAADESWFGGSVTQPPAPESSGPTTFARIYRVFLGARAALGLVLVIALLLAGAFGTRPSALVTAISLAYAACAFSMWLLPKPQPLPQSSGRMRLDRGRWLATVGVDVLCFSALHLLSRASSFSNVALLVLPILMASALTPRVQALATVSAVVIGLLVAGWFEVLAGGEATVWLTQAGLAGSGLFAIAVLTSELSDRLAREELRSLDSLALVRQEVLLNQLVIEEMHDGVLVVDRAGRVRTANPAARRLLSASDITRTAPFPLRGQIAWQALVETVERAFTDEVWPEEGRDVTLPFDAVHSRTLRVRIRFTQPKRLPLDAQAAPAQADEEFCVLLLEDVRTMQARNRQEKLAAMGRISAGIAHEIRNPLAAIAQANALLSEDAATPEQIQLTRMVAANVERLTRIVDDVMAAAPGSVQEATVIDVTALVVSGCAEWQLAAGAPAHALAVEAPDEPLGAWFDAEHLRRVLINLLDNARRHGSGAPGSVVVRLAAEDATRLVLRVASDGAPIAQDVERHLFEPFFSTRSRGTGLGLYICRELCERYSARIDYRLLAADTAARNEFFVVMRRHALPRTSAA